MEDPEKTWSIPRQGDLAHYKEIEKRQGGYRYANIEHERLLEVRKGSCT
jgi:hypothetical protein